MMKIDLIMIIIKDLQISQISALNNPLRVDMQLNKPNQATICK